MLKFTENFSMTFAENRTYGVPEFAGTEVNRHSGKLKGLSGYLQNHYPKYNIITSTAAKVNTCIIAATAGLFFFFINTNCLIEQYSDSVNK